MAIYYNLLSAHTVLIRTELCLRGSGQWYGALSRDCGHLIVTMPISFLMICLYCSISFWRRSGSFVWWAISSSWCFFKAAVVLWSALISIVPPQSALFPKAPLEPEQALWLFERAELKPRAGRAIKPHTLMASGLHPHHQPRDCHGGQSGTSPVAGSAASLSQLHFLNTFVFSLTKSYWLPFLQGLTLGNLLPIGIVLITFLEIQFFREFPLH